VNRDNASTLAGGGAGLAMLATVRWEAVPAGELVKIAVSLLLMVLGYWLYRGEGGGDGPGTTKEA
jgi:hypothetical protein